MWTPDCTYCDDRGCEHCSKELHYETCKEDPRECPICKEVDTERWANYPEDEDW